MTEDINLDMGPGTGEDSTFDDLFSAEPSGTPTEGEGAEEASGTPTEAEDAKTGEDAEEGGQAPAKEEKPPEAIEITFLGEKRRMPVAELTALAQKGLNYDHVAAELSLVDRYAEAAGMDRRKFFETMERQLSERELAKYTEGGVSREIAEKLVRLEADNRRRLAAEAETRKQQAQKDRFVALLREYPDAATNLPPEVAAAIGRGEEPLSAMRAWENRELRAKLSAKEQAAAAKAKNPGSVAGSAPEAPADEFMSGFGL